MKQWFAPNSTVRLDTTCPPCGRVLCFHGAGCDASLFVTKGTSAKPLPNPLLEFCQENAIELLSFQMPGRGARSNEPHFEDAREAAETALNALEPFLARSTPSQSVVGAVPLFIVGHSLGAFIAYEFACLMRRRNLPPPKQLVLACMVPPNLPVDRRPWRPVASLDDVQLEEEMRLWGINEEVFKPNIWPVFEPLLRKDLAIADAYNFAEPNRVNSPPRGSPTTTASGGCDSPNKKQSFHAPLGVDTMVVVGRKDQRVTKALAEGWNGVIMGTDLFSSSPSGMGTAAKNGSVFQLLEIDGGHNFLYEPEPRKAFFEAITAKLDRMLIDAEYGN